MEWSSCIYTYFQLKQLNTSQKEIVRFITCYEKKNTAFFCSAKDSIPIHQKANVIYKATCSGCHDYYVGKTDHNLVTRLSEQFPHEDQPMYKHLSKCEHFSNIMI